MLSEGKYSIWFKTPVGAGAGIVELGSEGVLTDGDPSFAYSGHWEQEGDLEPQYPANGSRTVQACLDLMKSISPSEASAVAESHRFVYGLHETSTRI
jgi:hypothetical protein